MSHADGNTRAQSDLEKGGVAIVACALLAIAVVAAVMTSIFGATTASPNEREAFNTASRTPRAANEADAGPELAEPEATKTPSAVDNTDGSQSDRESVVPVLLESDLGTGSREFSAVTLNEQLDRLLIVDDEGLLFEFDLDPTGLPVVPALRTIRITLGAGDTEGIAWIADQSYAIAHENNGQITVVNIDEHAAIIDESSLVRSIDTGVREVDGKGIEGVAYVGDPSLDVEFVAVRERPPMLLLINHAGEVHRTIDIELVLGDVSDVSVGPDGIVTLVSDEGQAVIDVALSDAQLTVRSSLDLIFEAGQFEQPEGVIRSRDGSALYVVGEKPGPGRITFGLWQTGS